MKERSKAAQDARQEFYDSVHFSDVFLLSIMFGFSIIGNLYPPQTRNHLIIGLVSFLSTFLIYLCIKASEPPKAKRRKVKEKREEKVEKKDEQPKKEKETLEDRKSRRSVDDLKTHSPNEG
eukprot:symbB.v1.2.013132.t1/scaffold916.1/size152367/8